MDRWIYLCTIDQILPKMERLRDSRLATRRTEETAETETETNSGAVEPVDVDGADVVPLVLSRRHVPERSGVPSSQVGQPCQDGKGRNKRRQGPATPASRSHDPAYPSSSALRFNNHFSRPDNPARRRRRRIPRGASWNGTMVSVTTNQRRRRRQEIRRQGGQGVVLDLTLKGDGIWNASVLLLSLWLFGYLALALWLCG